MLVVVTKAANVSSAAAAVRFLTHNVRRFCVVLGAEFLPLYDGAVAKASRATASTPAPPRQPLLLLLLSVSIPRKFLKVKNRLSVVMTSRSLSSLLHTRSMTECLCVGSMGGRELAVIMALVLYVTGHLRGRRPSAGCGGRRCCSNVLRELASFVSDRPTRLQLRVFIYTKIAVIAHTSKSIRKLLHMAGHPSSSQRIFQEDLEIPGGLQQHQIAIIYLGRPYSSSITNTYLLYF